MKLTDLEKVKGLKINSKMNNAVTPGRFAAAAHATVDRREQRKRDQAAGLIPFAVKLDAELVKRIQALALERESSINEVVAELLNKGLGD
jgi:Ribbon-helix-helix protein, copG family